MRITSALIVIAALSARLASAQGLEAAPASSRQVTLYVSATAGNDKWSGRLAQPNRMHTDGPFATFDRARKAVQSAKNGASAVTVLLRDGLYPLPATVAFGPADAGSTKTAITYQNYPNESPVLSGGLRVQGWVKVNGNLWQAKLPAGTQYFENLYYNGVRRLRPRLGGSLGTYYRVAHTVYSPTQIDGSCTVKDPNHNNDYECFDRATHGIRIGVPRTTLDTDANIPYSTTVVNNVVEGYGRIIPVAFGIAQGEGHDNLYSHNDVYDGYHCAISLAEEADDAAKPNGKGNADNTISFNHVHDLLQGIMNDGGSIRIESGDQAFTAAGNKILNNQGGPPYVPNQVFVVEDNLMVFDRDMGSDPSFSVQDGCTYSDGVGASAGFPYTSYELFKSNLYWHTEGGSTRTRTHFTCSLTRAPGAGPPSIRGRISRAGLIKILLSLR